MKELGESVHRETRIVDSSRNFYWVVVARGGVSAQPQINDADRGEERLKREIKKKKRGRRKRRKRKRETVWNADNDLEGRRTVAAL